MCGRENENERERDGMSWRSGGYANVKDGKIISTCSDLGGKGNRINDYNSPPGCNKKNKNSAIILRQTN